MSADKARPAINDRLCERRVILVSFWQSQAAPCTEDFHQIAGVALEVLSIWISVRVGGNLGALQRSCGSVSMAEEPQVVCSHDTYKIERLAGLISDSLATVELEMVDHR